MQKKDSMKKLWNPRWRPRGGCDGRIMAKVLITKIQANLNAGVKITFQKLSDQCQTNPMIDLTCQSANLPPLVFYTMVYSGPTWFVSLTATEQCCNVSYTNYTGENHSVNQTFLDLKNVKPNKEMGGYLANLVRFWSMADHYFHPWNAPFLQLGCFCVDFTSFCNLTW